MPLDALFAARVNEAAQLGPEASAEAVDQVMSRPYGPPEAGEVIIRHDTIPGPHGDIGVRIYRDPNADEAAPGLVWCHGGAFMWGDLDMPEADEVSRGIATRIRGVVVSVDYRLTGAGNPPTSLPLPDDLPHQFPVAHDEVFHAFVHVHDHASEFGIDPARLAIGGASAGANLISSAVVRLRDEQGPLPHVWLPIYPAVHLSAPDISDDLAADLAEHSSGFTPEALAFIGAAYGATPADRYGFIGELDDLGGLPRCLIINDQYDELRASGEELHRQLLAAGVESVCLMARGMKHGHLNLVGHPATKQSLDEMAAAILS